MLDIRHLSYSAAVDTASLLRLRTQTSDLLATLPAALQPAALGSADARIHDHGKRIGDTLLRTHREALESVRECGTAIDWLERYMASKSSLSELCESLSDNQTTFGELLRSFDSQDLDVAEDAAACTSWLAQSRDALDAYRSSNLTKTVTVALMKHRALLRGWPASLLSGPTGDMSDLLLDRSDTLFETVTTLAGRLTGKCDIVQRSLELGATIRMIQSSTDETSDLLADLDNEIAQYIDTALWSSLSSKPPDCVGWDLRLLAARQGLAVGIELKLAVAGRPMTDLLETHAEQLQRIQASVDGVKQRLEDVETLKSLACRVHSQTMTVTAVQREGEDLLVSIRAAQHTPHTAQDLQAKIRAWEADVVNRVPFIDIYHTQSGQAGLMSHVSEVYPEITTGELLTPPPSPPSTFRPRLVSCNRWDLAKTDRLVRTEINNITSRVKSQLNRVRADSASAQLSDEKTGINDVPALMVGSSSASVLEPRPDLEPTDISLESLRLSPSTSSPTSQSQLPTSTSTSISASSSRLPTPTRPRASLPRVRPSQNSSISSTLSHTSHSRPPIPFPMRVDRSRSISLGNTRMTIKSPAQRPRQSQTPRKYVANDRSQLDRAVGQIVNNLHVSVRIPRNIGQRVEADEYRHMYL